MPFDDEAWDEERWETFLRDHDRWVDRYVELIFRFMRKHPQPDPADAEALASWRKALRAWFRDKGWRFDDLILPFFWLEEDAGEEGDERTDDGDAFLPGGFAPFFDDEDPADDLDDVQRLPIYQRACQLSTEVLDWAHALSGDLKGTTLVYFCSHIAQVPAHLARGHGIGRERDALGGNIACAKRALAEANAALPLLRRLKRAAYMDAATYRRLSEQAFELRNALGLYVQELREQFNLGID